MTDEFAIQQILNIYSVNASLNKHEEMAATFAPDGIWEVPGIGLRCEGREAILQAAQGVTGAVDYLVQLNSPAIVEVDGDTATAQSVIRECGQYAGRQTALEVLGLYTDRLVRLPEGWRFAHRLFTVRGMHDFAITPAPIHE